MQKQKIGIVGGGIMGLTTALRLSGRGNEITVFESSLQTGGLAGSADLNGYSWDRFYHVVLLSDMHTRNLIKELGLEHLLKWNETKTGFYTGGKLYSMSDIFEFLKFPPLNLIDKIRLGLTILIASGIKNHKKLEKITVSDWLIKYSGRRTFTKIWLPLLRAKLGDGYKKTSAVFIWATIQRLYGARKNGYKKEMFGYIDGGYRKVMEAFGSILSSNHVNLKTGQTITEIYSGPSGKPVLKTIQNEIYEFDKIIITVPSGIAAQMCKGLNSDETVRLRNIQYLGMVCVSLLLDRSLSPFYVTNITESWVPFTGVIEMTALVDKNFFGGNSLIYLPKYALQDDPVWKKDDREVSDDFITALKKMYPWLTGENIKAVTVSRAKNVIALPTLHFSENLSPVKTGINGVYIMNSARITDGTLNVNETVKIAEACLTEIMKD